MSLFRRVSWLITALLIMLIPISAYAVKPAAQKHFDEAMRLKNTELAKAIVEMNAAIDLEPKWAEAHYHLATFYHQKKLFDDALREYKTVQKLNPKFTKVHYGLGALYYTQGVFAWTTASRFDDQYLYKDDGKQVFYKKGTSREKAIAQYKKIVEKDTTNAPAFYNLRGVYYDLAIIEYLQAVKANPNDTSAQYDLGLVYLERGMLDKAKAQIKVLEKLSPGHANGLQQQMEMEEAQKKMLKERRQGR